MPRSADPSCGATRRSRKTALSCHNAHGSNHARLLAEKAPNVCQDCHDASRHTRDRLRRQRRLESDTTAQRPEHAPHRARLRQLPRPGARQQCPCHARQVLPAVGGALNPQTARSPRRQRFYRHRAGAVAKAPSSGQARPAWAFAIPTDEAQDPSKLNEYRDLDSGVIGNSFDLRYRSGDYLLPGATSKTSAATTSTSTSGAASSTYSSTRSTTTSCGTTSAPARGPLAVHRHRRRDADGAVRSREFADVDPSTWGGFDHSYERGHRGHAGNSRDLAVYVRFEGNEVARKGINVLAGSNGTIHPRLRRSPGARRLQDA